MGRWACPVIHVADGTLRVQGRRSTPRRGVPRDEGARVLPVEGKVACTRSGHTGGVGREESGPIEFSGCRTGGGKAGVLHADPPSRRAVDLEPRERADEEARDEVLPCGSFRLHAHGSRHRTFLTGGRAGDRSGEGPGRAAGNPLGRTPEVAADLPEVMVRSIPELGDGPVPVPRDGREVGSLDRSTHVIGSPALPGGSDPRGGRLSPVTDRRRRTDGSG